MDPITHALIGANIAGLAGHPVSLSDPFFWGPTLAAMAPDLDIVMQFRSDLAYLQNHRGLSHSLPSLLVISGVITILLHFIFRGTVPILPLFSVTAAGALSHSVFDMLNSYGVRLLWPFFKKKIACNLVSLVEWVIIVVSLLSLAAGAYRPEAFPAWALVIVLYLVYRKWLAASAWGYLRRSFSQYQPQKIVVMPGRFRIFRWDFLIESPKLVLVGQIRAFSLTTEIRRKLEKTKANPFIEAALDSSLGKLFEDFTPHFHVVYREVDCRHMVQFMDLRYFQNQDFMHTGTVALDEQCCAIEQIFQPYSRRYRIVLSEQG